MAKIIPIILSMIFLVSLVSAQEIATNEDIKTAGVITPESPFYFADIATDRVLDIFSERAKIRHAKERMAEVKVMLENENIEKAEKTLQRYNNTQRRVISTYVLTEHNELANDLSQEIDNLQNRTQLTSQDRLRIRNLIQSRAGKIAEENSQNLPVKLQNKLLKGGNF